MLLQLALLKAESKILYNDENLAEFTKYCTPNYKFHDTDMKIKKIIVFFRHGDRTPFKFDKDTLWGDRNCIQCDENDCFVGPCKPGDLTIRGYEQSEQLGQFLKNYYFPKLKNKSISGSYTGVKRSLSALKGVLNVMEGYEQGIEEDNRVTFSSKCAVLRQRLSNSIKFLSKPGKKQSLNGKPTSDVYLTSLCSDVPLDCKKVECDSSKIKEYLENEMQKFQDYVAKYRENIALNGFSFAKLANVIKEKTLDDRGVILMSVHDSTILRLLNGFNINIERPPSYSTAVFIELLEDKGGKKYVRIIYEGNLQKFGLYNETYVLLDNFMKYLNMFAQNSDLVEEACAVCEGENDKKKLDRMAELIKNAFNPLQIAIADEVKKYDVSLKKKSSFASHLSSFLNSYLYMPLYGNLNKKAIPYTEKYYYPGKDKIETPTIYSNYGPTKDADQIADGFKDDRKLVLSRGDHPYYDGEIQKTTPNPYILNDKDELSMLSKIKNLLKSGFNFYNNDLERAKADQNKEVFKELISAESKKSELMSAFEGVDEDGQVSFISDKNNTSKLADKDKQKSGGCGCELSEGCSCDKNDSKLTEKDDKKSDDCGCHLSSDCDCDKDSSKLTEKDDKKSDDCGCHLSSNCDCDKDSSKLTEKSDKKSGGCGCELSEGCDCDKKDSKLTEKSDKKSGDCGCELSEGCDCDKKDSKLTEKDDKKSGDCGCELSEGCDCDKKE